MAFISIGDLARHFTSLHHISSTRSRLDVLTAELSSGKVADPAARLSGRTDLLADIEQRMALLDAGVTTTTSLLRRFENTQIALDQIDMQRANISKQLLSLPPAPTQQMIVDTAAAAEEKFEIIVGALGVRHGAESLFSGTATDQPALDSANTILTALRAAAAGAVDTDDLAARLDQFFDDPGGGFATIAYLGDTGAPLTRRIDGRDVPVPVRADDQALRDILKALASATLAVDTPAGATMTERRDLLLRAGADLITAAGPFTSLRAALGRIEEHAELSVSRQSAALTAATIRRNEMISANPEQTAVALQEMQTRLETQYTVTARLAGLSLAGYLR